jgi:hypothetical protein
MSLNKATGNMYPWVTHTWSVLHGACPHRCTYCYVKKGRTKGLPCYQGLPRFNEKDRDINLGCGKTIFVAHTSDLFAEGVPMDVVSVILAKCNQYRFNEYVIQSKDPKRAMIWSSVLPERLILGTTIETDDKELLSGLSIAPPPERRAIIIRGAKGGQCQKTFITVEPIMRFSDGFKWLLGGARPDFINIGADSKGCHLPEPTAEETIRLIEQLRAGEIEVRLKDNLTRIIGKEEFRRLSA